MEYLIYILIGWGITDFLVNGSILDKLRVYLLVKFPLLAKLLSCIRCSGFWVGVIMGIFSDPLFSFRNLEIAQILASGFLIAGSSVIINALMFSFYSRGTINNQQTIDEED